MSLKLSLGAQLQKNNSYPESVRKVLDYKEFTEMKYGKQVKRGIVKYNQEGAENLIEPK